MRDCLRRGQVRALRRNSILFRRLSLNRFDLVHGHDLAGRPCRYSNAASILYRFSALIYWHKQPSVELSGGRLCVAWGNRKLSAQKQSELQHANALAC